MTYQYHDALDRFEARMRAEQAERELDEQKPLCICLEYIGDNGPCPVHGGVFTDAIDEDPEGSDASAFTQWSEHGYY